ncbi:MAG: RNA polymerase sigma factor RpoD/SigA [Saprospiraceae bacterium]|nr:RNA polymerase sigma factor RpoD/SigA [Saprospiraceae bacterium]MBK6565894.1 RNA polymerase sigma factor RpoD/SigA [Saprospiraceae bacterium]MBK8370095.1 RNA polymerase sigma factor RpoD/SigA [Saprospiraceae bacterium]MBK8546893.1 RNA polymerase sigma factor RpoD/SigA [Saprospiraceae bacterium]MBK8818020.1 RNA polymerase sigma factor RpoD/SigA [Saprospiraceae bacterium]
MRQLKISTNITSRESLALEKYLNDIGKIELLTPEQETELAKKIKTGDAHALETMTKANLRFVVSVAKQYQNQGLSLADLINEGNVGLMKAAKRFDETKGFKFISYAVWWIRQSILQAIVEYSRMVRIPLNRLTAYNKVNDAWLNFVQKYEREPTHQELAEILNVSEKDIAQMLKGNIKHISVDAPISDDDNSVTMVDMMTQGDAETPDLKLMEESLRMDIFEGLEVLSPREAEIIKSFYGLGDYKPMSLEEIAEMYDMSKERVRQIKEKSLRRMRRLLHKNLLNNFNDV